jgi:hypothetical protein
MATAGPEKPEKKEANPDRRTLYDAVLKGFKAFLGTDVARQIVDQKFIDRLVVGANIEIETLNQLMRQVKERWPDHFHTDPRKATSKPYNKEVIAKLWAAYLQWREEA